MAWGYLGTHDKPFITELVALVFDIACFLCITKPTMSARESDGLVSSKGGYYYQFPRPKTLDRAALKMEAISDRKTA